MRLSDFIRQNHDAIISQWEAFATTMTPAADSMSMLQLRDHAAQILSFIATDIESGQTKSEQASKSRGETDGSWEDEPDSAAETHGGLRHDSGFDIMQMFAEYRALRASIIQLWTQAKKGLDEKDVLDLTRFNESIDQAVAESVVRFVEKVDYSRGLLLGVLGHDLRSPLGAINMSAQLLPRIGDLTDDQRAMADQIGECSTRVIAIVTDLLNITRSRMGAGLPVQAAPVDMADIARQIVAEMRVQFPDREITLAASGDVTGEWDATRLGQVFSNLVGNAIQYGAPDQPVSIGLKGGKQVVTASIHNAGPPIPRDRLATLFDSFTRSHTDADSTEDATNLGLGLFIVREIVASHGGSIDVTSSQREGTIFTVELPRRVPSD